jgi:hypothetical protein
MRGLPYRPVCKSSQHNESSWLVSVVRPRHNKTPQLFPLNHGE